MHVTLLLLQTKQQSVGVGDQMVRIRFLPTDTHSFLSLTLVGLHLVLQLVHQVLQSDVVLLIFLRLKGVKPLSFLIFTTRTFSVAKAQCCRGIT